MNCLPSQLTELIFELAEAIAQAKKERDQEVVWNNAAKLEGVQAAAVALGYSAETVAKAIKAATA